MQKECGYKMKKRIGLLFLLILLVSMTSCKKKEEIDENRIFQVNYISNEEIKVVTREYVMQSDLSDVNGQIEELLDILGKVPDKLEYKPPLAQGFSLLSYQLQEGKLILNMDEKYMELSVAQEILTRAAFVRTLTQIEGVDYVGITVGGQSLTDNLGNPVGLMSAETFIDNEGSQINSMEQTRIRLYFANADGTQLVPVNRTLVYSTNLSVEKLVVEQLVAGPASMAKDVFPTINPATKVLSVTINDGICYINFDETFLNQIYSVPADVTIYSIVNSMVELPNVNKVQISINGETDVMYQETISLSTVFERNLEIINGKE